MKEKTKSYQMDMCTGSIGKKMLFYAFPLICSGILQLLFNAADIVVVGRYAGEHALAAVGANTALINLMVNLFMGLSIGANVVVAKYYGAKKDKDISETVHTALMVAVVSGLILLLIGGVGAGILLTWMDTPKEILGLAQLYLRIYFLGMPAMMVYNFGSAILRAIGDTKRPLYYLLLAGVVNVCFNLIFVICFHMSVAGVAIATVISQCVSAILVVRCLMREEGSIRLELSKLCICKDKFIQILKIGLPAGFQGTLFSLSNVVIQSSVNSFGTLVVSGNTAASNIEGFVYTSMNAFHQATISFTGQNVGANQYKRVPKILFTGIFYAIFVGLVFGNIVLLFKMPLLAIYSNNAEVIAAGVIRLKYILKTYFLCGVMDVLVGGIRGMGSSILPMIISLVGVCGIRLLWIGLVFSQKAYHTIETVYITYPITWSITIVALSIAYFVIYKKNVTVQPMPLKHS